MSWDAWANIVPQGSKSHCTCAIILGHDGAPWGRCDVDEKAPDVQVIKDELLRILDALKNDNSSYFYENGLKCIAGRRYICTQVIDGVIRAYSRDFFGLYITTTKQTCVIGLSDETGGRDVNNGVTELREKLLNAGY